MTDLPSRMRFVKEHSRKDFTRQILKFFCIMVDSYQCLLIAGDRPPSDVFNFMPVFA